MLSAEERRMPKANNPDRCLYEDPPGFWCIRIYDPRTKKRLRRRVGSKAAARNVLIKLQGDIARWQAGMSVDGSITLVDLVEMYQAEWQATKRTSRNDDRYADYFVEAFGRRAVKDLTPKDIIEWRTSYLAGRVPSVECLDLPKGRKPPTSRKPASANRAIAFLRKLFNRAVRDSVLEANPAAKVKALAENNTLNNWLRPGDQEEALRLQFKPADWRICELGIHTGLRASNLFEIRREDVDLKNGFVRIGRTKNEAAQDLPLTDRAHDILKEMLEEHDSEWLLPAPSKKRAGGPRLYSSWYSKVFKKAVERAGLQLRFHDLRHTFGSRLVDNGVPIYEVAALMNHKTLEVVKRYAHLEPDRLRASIKRLDAKALAPEDAEKQTLTQ
ncbi:MAG: hypothetical protein AMXMBFR33_35880 [Candidatus Xenobia bacterium]